jgi:hypothetical protein
MQQRPDRSLYRMRRLESHDAEPADEPRFSPEECIGMMEELAMNAWAFMGVEHVEPRLQRHVVRLIRRPS